MTCFLDNVKERFPNEVEWAIVSSEKHKDDTPHLHAAICFKEKKKQQWRELHTTLEKLVISEELPSGKRGNFQTLHHLRKCVKYITKEGKYEVLGNLNVKSLSEKHGSKCSKSSRVAQSILEGQTREGLIAEDPGFYMMNKRKIEEFLSLKEQMDLEKNFEKYKITKFEINPEDPDIPKLQGMYQLESWLNSNVTYSTMNQRTIRQKQLWLHGPPGIGKTRLKGRLEKKLMTYIIPKDENFCDMYEDQRYKLAILDEYRGEHKIGWLNSWLDGSTFMLRVKGGQYLKKKNIPTMIIANNPIEEIYGSDPGKGERAQARRKIALEALKDRVEEVYIPEKFLTTIYFDEEVEQSADESDA